MDGSAGASTIGNKRIRIPLEPQTLLIGFVIQEDIFLVYTTHSHVISCRLLKSLVLNVLSDRCACNDVIAARAAISLGVRWLLLLSPDLTTVSSPVSTFELL